MGAELRAGGESGEGRGAGESCGSSGVSDAARGGGETPGNPLSSPALKVGGVTGGGASNVGTPPTPSPVKVGKERSVELRSNSLFFTALLNLEESLVYFFLNQHRSV